MFTFYILCFITLFIDLSIHIYTHTYISMLIIFWTIWDMVANTAAPCHIPHHCSLTVSSLPKGPWLWPIVKFLLVDIDHCLFIWLVSSRLSTLVDSETRENRHHAWFCYHGISWANLTHSRHSISPWGMYEWLQPFAFLFMLSLTFPQSFAIERSQLWRVRVCLIVQRRNGPISKIPQAHSTFVTWLPHCPSPQCSYSQPHGNSSRLLETHTKGLWVVSSCQENEVIYIPNTWFWNLYGWRRKWQPTPVFLPGDSHAQRSLAGYRT